uniref:Ribosomal L1 domain-containing protein 1 n=1 Tax=Castor canadensis TaxID=51338 RepID=A0A8B7UV91_CASCN|nr:ribosomal L1 domain-containing protein 1 [Castor canadensis]
MEDSGSVPPSASASAATPTSAPADPTTLEHLDENQVRKAVEALLAHCRSRKSNNALLLNEKENLFLMVVLWKIPEKELRIKFSWSLSDVFLNVALDNPFPSFKTEYKAYEAKLRLLGVLISSLLMKESGGFLPSHIGRHFYQGRSKFLALPVLYFEGLSLKSLLNVVLNSSSIRIGHTGMQIQDITENIIAVAENLARKLPEKWQSVKLLFVKTEKSVSLPIFSSFVSCVDESSKVSFHEVRRRVEGARSREKQKKKNRKLKRKAQNAAESILSLDDLLPASVTGVPVKGSEARKKRTGRVKGRSKVTDEAEDEIPQLVPIADTPAKENSEILKNTTGKKSPKKNPGPNIPGGKKRKVLAAGEASTAAEPGAPGKGPEKKLKMEPKAKDRSASLGKKDQRQTPKKPEAKFFANSRNSAKKTPNTPKQGPKAPKVAQST